MDLSSNTYYQQIKERMKTVDLRSPYYALAAADFKVLDELLISLNSSLANSKEQLATTQVELEAWKAKADELYEQLSSIALKLSMAKDEINQLKAENEELKAQLLTTITDPPVTEPVPQEPSQ